MLCNIINYCYDNKKDSTFHVFLKDPSQMLVSGAPNDNFRKNICSEDDLRSRIFEIFIVKFLACLPLLGFSNTQKWYICLFLTDFTQVRNLNDIEI